MNQLPVIFNLKDICFPRKKQISRSSFAMASATQIFNVEDYKGWVIYLIKLIKEENINFNLQNPPEENINVNYHHDAQKCLQYHCDEINDNPFV